MTKHPVILFAFALAAALSLAACQNTRVHQENEQLKTQVLELQKQLGEMGNRLDEATTVKDDLIRQNASLKEENNRLKARRGGKKASTSKRNRRRRP